MSLKFYVWFRIFLTSKKIKQFSGDRKSIGSRVVILFGRIESIKYILLIKQESIKDVLLIKQMKTTLLTKLIMILVMYSIHTL